jgi:phosphoribosylaminoimidazole-succinocarboxamide synthase/formyltetrahydrofolate-dependent phosphoribosylglycinamide formyltransferase
MLNIVVLISGNGTNLQALIDACEVGTINGMIKCVISNNEMAKGIIRAENHGINTKIINNNLLKILDDLSPDLVVLAGYMRVLESNIVNAYRNKIINLHPALPGSYVGKYCIRKAWGNRFSCNSTGVMVHWVTEELDRGDYISAVRIPIYIKDSYDELESRVTTYEKKVLVDTVKMIAELNYHGENVKSAEKYPHIYTGKVREIYDIGKDLLAIEHTDRLSSFDRHICNIPGKGQILTETSAYWFNRIDIPHHYLNSSGNIMIVKKCNVVPIEVVVRGYITGSTQTSLWTHYKKGVRYYCGIEFLDGLVKNQKLSRNVITPTTKGEVDELITAEEIVKRELVTQSEWDYISEVALELFKMGQEHAASRGLILVDTKYEFGRDSYGNLLLIDEVHTCDSSRYWIQESYDKRMAEGKEPEKYDKDVVRDYIKAHVKDPYSLTTFDVPDELIEKTYSTYSTFFSVLTGYYTLPEMGDRDDIINKYFDNIDWILRPHLVILSGSESDADHVNKIQKMAEKYNIQTISHVASAHKNTQKVLNILDFYNSQKGKVIFVAVAGRSNALGGVVACNTDYPTIACPPFKDKIDMQVNINSTLQCPSKVPVMTIIEPINVVLSAKKIFEL